MAGTGLEEGIAGDYDGVRDRLIPGADCGRRWDTENAHVQVPDEIRLRIRGDKINAEHISDRLKQPRIFAN
jgi:hypothetical protein